jgi:hypothetical protein
MTIGLIKYFHYSLLEKLTLLKRETAKVTHPLYSSGLRLTNASIKLTAAVATP